MGVNETDSLAADLGPDPHIGEVIEGKYEVKRLLGAGGMGSVYEGVHRLIGKRVAIKILHPEYSRDPDIVERFQREARAATAIGHPNIVDVNDMGRLPKGGFFQVLELLEGRTFGDEIEGHKRLSIGRMARILSQVADALAAAHDKGIVHRDLKPDNVFLVSREGREDFVKLLDFGIAKFLDTHDVARRSGPATRTGAAIGTPQYMSPEQAQGLKTVDKRSDIFSLGVMAYEALAGVRPFEADSLPLVIMNICTAAPPPLAKYRPGAPPELVAVVERMLAKSPEQRFDDCRQVKAALAPFVGIEDDPPATPSSGAAHTRIGPPITPAQMRVDPMARTITPVPTGTTPTPVTTTTDAAPPRTSRTTAITIAVLAVSVVVLGAIVLVDRGGSETTAATTPPPSARTVHVIVRAEPEGATLTVDGVPVIAPYDATRAADDAPHVVRAELAGHGTETRTVSFASDVELTLTLAALPAVDVAVPASEVPPSAVPASAAPASEVPASAAPAATATPSSSPRHGHGHETSAPAATPEAQAETPTPPAHPTSPPPSSAVDTGEPSGHAPPLKRVVF